MKHSMHFTGNEEMSYAASHLDTFIRVSDVVENEFDGDHENEVTFTTSSPISKTKLLAIIKYFQPAGYTFNQQ